MPTRIVEGQLPYTGGTGIGIDTNKVISVLLREENNLIQVNGDNELYTDLQLVANIKPSDDFPVGVTTGKILQSDGWTQSGLLLNWKTTSGDYARWIYANDGKIYFDNGTGTWKQVYYSSEVDNLIQTLRNYVDATYQPKLTAGAGITIDQNNVISSTGGQGAGDVVGPNSSVDGNVALFDGNTGKLIKDGGALPSVINNLTSTSTTDALSAAQGKALKDAIDNISGLGKFLSLWNSSTGQPISFPLATPYTYTTGDWFMVETVGTTNYKPNGSSYTGTASTTVETETVEQGDVYIYDGTTWLLQKNTAVEVSFSAIAGQPTDNAALSTALGNKQDKLVSGTNIKTVNSTSLLGSGNVSVQPTLVSGTNIKTVNSTSLLGSGNVAVQPTLVSGTNIKTVNSKSLLGSGNIAVQATISDLSTIRTNATNGATVVSGDSGVTYTIKVSNSDPSGASSTTITLVP